MLGALSLKRPLAARVAGQGAVLLGGYGLSQAFSFLRNALIGHALSRGDFGIAATITMLLQLIDTVSELGADRLIMQAGAAGSQRLVDTAQSLQVARGLATAALLFLSSALIADFFAVPEARWAFALASLVPLVRGFLNLDVRRAQGDLDNRAAMVIDVVPQATALAATPLLLSVDPSFGAVLWLALLQAVVAVLASHLMAKRPYRLALDRGALERIVAFGWPIWLSGLPLIAVYQGDRAVIGRMFGMEPLAAYSAAFMLTMVPGLIAGKIGGALMLPLLAEAQRRDGAMRARFLLLAEATALAACAYLALFLTLGGDVLRLAFGPNYAGLNALIAWLALMWALRMIQAVPGMALMAVGDTRALLIAGLIRAAALPLALIAAYAGEGVNGVAAAGTIGEIGSLIYVALRIDKREPGLSWILIVRALLIVPFGFLALAVAVMLPATAGFIGALAAAAMVLLLISAGGVAAMPGLRKLALELRPMLFGA